MKLFQVVQGVVQIPGGAVVSIEDKYFKRRSAFVDVMQRGKEGGRHTVRLKRALDFKVGEVIGLADPFKSERLIPVEPVQAPKSKAA